MCLTLISTKKQNTREDTIVHLFKMMHKTTKEGCLDFVPMHGRKHIRKKIQV